MTVCVKNDDDKDSETTRREDIVENKSMIAVKNVNENSENFEI